MGSINKRNDHSQDSPSTRRKLIILLAIFLLSRLLFATVIAIRSGPGGFLSPDSHGYIKLSQALMHGSFSSDGVPELLRTPGYPVLLLPAVAFSHPVVVGLLENLLLTLFSAWLIWEITRNLFPRSNAATWAVILYCAEPVSAVYSERILSETLFCTQILLFLWLLLRFLNKPSYVRLLLTAIALAFATYTRPVSVYIGMLLVPLLLIFSGQHTLARRIRFAVIFACVFSVALIPWTLRNKIVADYGGFSSVANWNLYFMSAAAVQAKLEHRSFMQVSGEWGNASVEYFTAHPEQRSWSQGAIARFWGTEATRVLLQHPLVYSLIHLRGCAVALFDPAITEILKPLGLYPESGGLLNRTVDQGFLRSVLWLLHEYPIAALLLPLLLAQVLLYYALAIAGLRQCAPLICWIFMVLISYFIVVSAFPAVTARYRAPIMPLICIAAGSAIAAWQDRRASKAAVTG